MNILFISNHLNIGGISSYLLTLIPGLKKRGHRLFIASSQGQLLYRFIEEEAVYVPIPIRTKQEISPSVILSTVKLLGLIRDSRIDIVHSHSRTTQVVASLLNRFTGLPHISTCHGFFKKRISRRLFPCWGDRVIAISEQVKEHLVADFKVPSEKIAVIPNGIDALRFKKRDSQERIRVRKRFGLGDSPVVGIVGRLSDVKGHRYLIEAIRYVLERVPQARLAIVGEGKMKEELMALSSQLGIEKSIVFMPEVYDTRPVLWAMDIFAMPSVKEGLGLALMEAMASGLAVIGSNIGGIKSLIQDRVNGILVEPQDVQGLASAIIELFEDPAKRESLGQEAQGFIEKNFSQEKMVSETERVYRECLDARS